MLGNFGNQITSNFKTLMFKFHFIETRKLWEHWDQNLLKILGHRIITCHLSSIYLHAHDRMKYPKELKIVCME